MKTIDEIQNEIIGDFEMYSDWADKYEYIICLLYTSDAADERSSVDLGGRRIIKKKTHNHHIDQLSTHINTDVTQTR